MRNLPKSIVAAIALAGASCGPPSGPPNVVLVTLDTTRPDRMSCYGFTPGSTPSFDALAADGVRFERAVTSSALTPVSHASILTGTYQYHHGLRVLWAESGYELPADRETLTTRLRAEGYSTAAIHSAFPVSSVFGFAHGFDHFDGLEASFKSRDKGKARWDLKQRRSDDTTALVLDWLETAEEPFFLWVHYWDPHDPALVPPEEYLEGIQRSPEGEYHHVELYAAEVRYVDEQFGRLVEGLRRRGAYDRTALVVTADHGEGLDDGFQRHGWSKHRMVYEEQLRVPLLLRLPDGPRGVVVQDLVRTVDIVPTLYAALGIESDVRFDGRPLQPLFEGGGGDEPRIAYADQVNGYDHNAGMVRHRPDAAYLYSVQDAEWKLIYRPHMPERSELFHLPSDPGEVQNRFATDPVVAGRLLEDLARRNPWVVAAFPTRDGRPGDVSATLEELGYSGGNEGDDLTWVWTCPRHPDHVATERARHECGAILVPRLP